MYSLGLQTVQQTEQLSLSLSFPVTTTAISLEKEMATHSSILAWEISWIEEPGRLQLFPGRQQGQLNEYEIITCWTKLLW